MAKAIANDWQCEEIRCIAMNDTWRFNGQWRRRRMFWLVFGESQVFAVHVFCWCFGYASFPKQAVAATSMFVDAFWWEFSLPLHFAKQYLSLNCWSLYNYLNCNLIHKQCCRYFDGKTNQNYAKFCCDAIVGIYSLFFFCASSDWVNILISISGGLELHHSSITGKQMIYRFSTPNLLESIHQYPIYLQSGPLCGEPELSSWIFDEQEQSGFSSGLSHMRRPIWTRDGDTALCAVY